MQILLAEDDREIRDMILLGLRLKRLSADAVENGAIAVERAAASDAFKLILLDMHMPVMTGLEAAMQIRSLPNHANTPILFLSGDGGLEDAEISNARLLMKPFTVSQLTRTVGEMLAKSAEPTP